ncbi:MAG: NAD-dependent epimerase/dehydratase family protein [Peptococcia bacterium]|jgi:UDP-glucose 4-epimerase
MKQVLVTGGAGFIGSSLVRMLVIDYGCNVTVLDNMHTGRLENLQKMGIERQVEFLGGTVLDRNLLAKAMRGKDTVFHLATVNMLASSETPRLGLETNIIGTYNVLDEALKAEVEKVVYTSTSSVYGNADHFPIKENQPVQFLSFYAASKYAGESYAQVFQEQYGLPVAILRYSNVYGPYQDPQNPYAGVVAKFIDWALHNQPLVIYENGSQTRDFTYIQDACRAAVLAALGSFSNGGIYNIGTALETSINDLAGLIIKLTESKSVIRYESKRSIDNIQRRVLDVEKARQELHFVPEWTLTGGLRKTIDWARHGL